MTNELALNVASLKVLSDYATNAYNAAREEIAPTLGRGDRVQVRSPLDDVKIGPVWKTDPKPHADVVDGGALLAWFQEHHPELVGSTYVVSGTDAEVVDALFKFAPHLLKKSTAIKTEALRELRTNSVALGQPVGPDGEADVPGLVVRTPPPVVQCKPDPETALVAVVQLVQDGRLDLHATLMPRVLEASPDDRS
jgi:hypothetical protein